MVDQNVTCTLLVGSGSEPYGACGDATVGRLFSSTYHSRSTSYSLYPNVSNLIEGVSVGLLFDSNGGWPQLTPIATRADVPLFLSSLGSGTVRIRTNTDRDIIIARSFAGNDVLRVFSSGVGAINIAADTNDTASSMNLVSKAGGFRFRVGAGGESIGTIVTQITSTSTSVNGFTFQCANAGVSPLLTPLGTDTNLDLRLGGKGTGSVRTAGNLVLGTGGSVSGDGGGITNIAFSVTNGNLRLGSATGTAKAVTDTVGWPMMPSVAGTPTGVPQNETANSAAFTWDRTNARLWVRNQRTNSWNGVLMGCASGCTVSADGQITVAAASGVSSITGTAGQITASASTGPVTLSFPSSMTMDTVTVTGWLTQPNGPRTTSLGGTLVTSGAASTCSAPTINFTSKLGMGAGKVYFTSGTGSCNLNASPAYAFEIQFYPCAQPTDTRVCTAQAYAPVVTYGSYALPQVLTGDASAGASNDNIGFYFVGQLTASTYYEIGYQCACVA